MLNMEHDNAGGRGVERAVGERNGTAPGHAAPAGVPDPELIERAKRRRFTAEYKLAVLREADGCTQPGQVEHTLYEDLGRTRRARLHQRVAEALEQRYGDEAGERLGELAGHWASAVVSTNTAKALHYAQLAAEHALAALAPDEAARWYRKALELYDQAPGGTASERCELLIGLGEAQRQIGNPEFRRTLLEAAELAQDLSDTDRLRRAVLANSRGWVSHAGAVDSERVRALEAAAKALPDHDPWRARVLALLACELHYAGEPARCRRLAAEAIEIARAAGDPVALAHTIFSASWAIWVPDTLGERQWLIDELVELAQRLDDPWLSMWAAARSTVLGLEAGDRSRVESGLAATRALAASVPQPSIAYMRLGLEASWALVQGDLQESERWATAAFEVGTVAREPDAMMLFGADLSHVRLFQGRLGELVEQIVQLVGAQDSLPAWRAATALALIESGRADEARELARVEDFNSLPWDDTWSTTMFFWANVCSRLRVLDRAGELYELLAPFSGQLASAGGGDVFGSIAWAPTGSHEKSQSAAPPWPRSAADASPSSAGAHQSSVAAGTGLEQVGGEARAPALRPIFSPYQLPLARRPGVFAIGPNSDAVLLARLRGLRLAWAAGVR
jgi:hypothetical protein